ncbi:MAG: TonB family protein [Pseudomonadota bacterium]
MIAASRWIAASALAIAAALHLMGIMRLDLTDDIEIAGGQAGAVQASLGDAFADLSEGTLTAVETKNVTEPLEVEDTAADLTIEKALVEADPTSKTPRREPDAAVAQTPVDMALNHWPPEAVVTAATPLTSDKQPDPQAAIGAVTRAEPVPTPTLRATAPKDRMQTATVTAQIETLSAVTPIALTPLEAEVQPETLTADELDQLEVTQSLRPKVRSRAFERRNKPDDSPPAPRRVTRAEQATPAPRGNQAQTNARAGQTDGAANAAASQRATGNQRSANAGKAAVSNYPGKVVRRIQRVRRPRIKDAGAPAVVTFRIAANGGLSAVAIRSSSGSAKLDRAAIQMIQRAAPFPPPPPGAQRSFNLPIYGG